MVSNQKQTYCLAGRYYSQTFNQNVYEKKNTKKQKVVRIKKKVFVVFVIKKNHSFLPGN